MSSIFDYYLNQPADAYLAAHGGQVPDFEQVLADLTAAKPRRAALLAFLADALHQDLLALSASHASAARPQEPIESSTSSVDEARACGDLFAQIWRHPQRLALISAITALLAAMRPAPTTPTEGATL